MIANEGVVSGRVVHASKLAKPASKQQIVVAPVITHDKFNLLENAAGIITEHGGQTSDIAIFARELNIPCLVKSTKATKRLKPNQLVTLDATHEAVYLGKHSIQTRKLSLPKGISSVSQIATKNFQYITLEHFSQATRSASHNISGVLFEPSSTLLESVGVYPAKLSKKDHQKAVKKLTEKFVELSHMFYPKDIIYQISDLTSDDYLQFEKSKSEVASERNPLLGDHGLKRLVREPSLFSIELSAFKAVSKQHNHHNWKLALPFVRSPEELTQAYKVLKQKGYIDGKKTEIYIKIEVPNIIFCLESISRLPWVKGFITNLTRLDNLLLAEDFEPRIHKPVHLNQGVQKALEIITRTARRHQLEHIIDLRGMNLHPAHYQDIFSWGCDSVSSFLRYYERSKINIFQAEKHLHINSARNTSFSRKVSERRAYA